MTVMLGLVMSLSMSDMSPFFALKNRKFHMQNATYLWIVGWNWHVCFKLNGF